MNLLKKTVEYLKKPYMILLSLDKKNIIRLSDKKFLEYRYLETFNRKIDWNNPREFNEKLQWLKLYNRKDIYSKMVDKYEAKKYVANIIGNEYVIPTLGIYDNFDDINFDKLPNQFVIKCTHDSGGLVIVKDKSKLDIDIIKNKINNCMKKNYYHASREWPYKNVKPRILVEKYMEDDCYHELRDYKIYAFNGKCDYLMLCFDRFKNKTKYIYFDRNWNIEKEFSNDGIKYGDTLCVEKPKNLKKMFEFASLFSCNHPFIRVDFYEVNGKLYFGEFTFFPTGGFDNTRTKECELYLDNALNLDEYILGRRKSQNENYRICEK